MQAQRYTGSTVRPLPNRRDLRKYARLFVKTDQDGDGFVSSDEAYSLFTRSHLPEDALQQIWALSNVSASGMLSFTEFIAAMHLIREARQSQQSPSAISPDLSAFLGSFSESPQDLSVEGSSQSARALQNSRSPSPAPVSTLQGTSSPHFGHAPVEDSFGALGASQPFSQPLEEPPVEDGKKKKGKKKEKKEKSGEVLPSQPSQAEPEAMPWDSGQVTGGAPAEQGDLGSAWTTFGDAQENPESSKGKREKKDKKEKKEKELEKGARDEKQTRFQPDADVAPSWPSDKGGWSSPSHTPTPAPQTSFGIGSGFSHSSQASQPQTRMGLRFDLDFGKDADPDYKARLQEILDLRQSTSPPATSPRKKEPVRWAGRRNDGHFEDRYTGAYRYVGDYSSPSLQVALMGFRSSAQGPAVLPQPGRPFLKSLTPHFAARSSHSKDVLEGVDSMTRSLRRLTFVPMTAA